MEAMIKDRKIRIAVTKGSHYLFFHIYFPHYVKYVTAFFQQEIFNLTEDESLGNFFLVAFRSCGKSTILTTSYPLWAILGKPQKKFVLILCQTMSQAKQQMTNLRRELESNDLLKSDLGPFKEESNEWGAVSLVFSESGARITAASTEQSIRGLRHRQHRPDLIICDDVEDMASTKTREGRNKAHQWLTGEVIPAGDKDTRLVVIGNLLHEDSLLMRLKQDVEERRIDGVFKAYPLLDENNKPLWSGKYPNLEAVESERRRVGNDISWKREFLLVIVPDEDQAIDPAWIHYYDELPKNEKPRKILIGVDPAISQKETADYTAIVVAYVYGYEKDFRVYIRPFPINKRVTFPETVETIITLHNAHKMVASVEIIIEDVGYQRALVDQLVQKGFPAVGVKILGDKRSRLVTISNLIESGKIRFSQKGNEQLTQQMIGFGVENHDDLVDSFTLVAHKTIELDRPMARVMWIYSN